MSVVAGSKIISDNHRFGKKVTRLQMLCEGRAYLHKPRSTHLEKLFLDPTSPIASELHSLYPLNGDYYSWNEGNSYCLELENSVFDCKSDFESQFASVSLGKFVALSLIVGFTDLHRENCFFIRDNKIPYFYSIDLESIFYPLNSLFDTGIFCKNRYGDQDISGYLANTASNFKFSGSHILDGFVQFWSELLPIRTELIKKIYSEMLDKPIRLIFQDTMIYRNALINPSMLLNSDFTKEELIQLIAGDIPYFFCFHQNSTEVLYYSSENTISVVSVESLRQMKFKSLLTEKQITDDSKQLKLFQIGAAQLAKKFLNLNGHIRGNYFDLSLSESNIFQLNTSVCKILFRT